MKRQFKDICLVLYELSSFVVAFLPFIPVLLLDNDWYFLLMLITIPISFIMYSNSREIFRKNL